MTGLWWFLAGLAVLPMGFGMWWAGSELTAKMRWWCTRPVDLSSKTIAYRRSLVVGLSLEILDATHVRAIRLPFNRLFIIRSTPRTEYDFVGKQWVVIGDDFENTEQLMGAALDALGYTEGEDHA